MIRLELDVWRKLTKEAKLKAVTTPTLVREILRVWAEEKK